MSMSHQTIRLIKKRKIPGGDAGGCHIFYNRLGGTAMHQVKIALRGGQRQTFQILNVNRAQTPGRPATGGGRCRVEIREVELADSAQVVIADDTNGTLRKSSIQAEGSGP